MNDIEQWPRDWLHIQNETIKQIEHRAREYVRELGESYSLEYVYKPSTQPLVPFTDPTVFQIVRPDGGLLAELVLAKDEQDVYVDLRTNPELDQKVVLKLLASIDPSEWYGPVFLSLREGRSYYRPIVIDNIASTLNYFVPWLARRSRSVLTGVPGHRVYMELTPLSGFEEGITNPVRLYQELVLQPMNRDLREWRGIAIHHTIEEIAPSRIRLEAWCDEIELPLSRFESIIGQILDTWPEARCRTELTRPENSSVDPIKTILFVASGPSDLPSLRLGEEVREIFERLRLSNLRDRFRLEQLHATRAIDLTQALLDTKPNIVHFSGHGTSEGLLYLENSSGLAHPVTPDALGALFGGFAGDVDCVILNVCHSEAQATSIAEHIRYVIGMNEAISDRAAVAFSTGFYQALGAGLPVEEAHRLGCVQIALQGGVPEQANPVFLISRQ